MTTVQQLQKSSPSGLMNYLGILQLQAAPHFPKARPLIGVLEGTGIGPQVVGSTRQILKAVGQVLALKFESRHGGLIGKAAIAEHGRWLPEATADFCADIFQHHGGILNGPGGGRYVYDLRRRFNLFCKFIPVRPAPELVRAGKIAPQFLQDVDMLIVRDNTGGVYQGQSGERATDEGRGAEHLFNYIESQLHRLVEVAARAATSRRGNLPIIAKDGGVPTVTALWRDVGGCRGLARWVAHRRPRRIRLHHSWNTGDDRESRREHSSLRKNQTIP